MTRLYVIVRSDLAPGLQVAQACHAVAAFAYEHRQAHDAWVEGESNLVVLQARDEAHLLELLGPAPGQLATFCEPDLNGEMTAFAASEAHPSWSCLPLALRSRTKQLPLQSGSLGNPG